MPPLPKRKYPKSRQGKRRSHIHLQPVQVIECPQCRTPRPSHQVCPNCGSYHGRQAVAMPGPALPE